MLTSILQYISGMHHTIKKENVIKTLDMIYANLNNEVLPTFETLINSGNVKKINDSGLLDTLARGSNIKYKNNLDAIIKLRDGFVSINKAYSVLLNIVEKELSDTVMDKTITAKDSAILRVITDLGGMNSFILDFLYLIMVNENDSDFPKIKFKNIKTDIPSFTASFKIYGNDFDKVLKDLPNVSTSVIDISDGKESMLEIILGKTGKLVNLPVATGFINNPIYHFRMWLVDREVVKFESLKDKKKLIELRLLELKLEESGEGDPKLRKQIEYYENKLSKLEYEIAKLDYN